MSIENIKAEECGLLIVDLQNDFLHADGAYGRAEKSSDAIARLPATVLPVANALRAAGGWVISTQFTLVPGKDDMPFIAPHLSKLRPFLGRGDFYPGKWGHQLVEELQPADLTVEKVAYSAFYQTRMEFVLKKAGIRKLYICGIVTNGGVASTVRAAHVRDFAVTVLSDGCAAFSDNAHNNALADLGSISLLCSCTEAVSQINALSQTVV